MKANQAVYRRLLRRETHSSRSGAAVVFAALLAVALLALIGLAVWAGFDEVFRERALAWIDEGITGMAAPAVLIGVGIGCLVVAVLLLLTGLLPGRRTRHARAADRFALVADDGVLADAAADAVSRECALGRAQISTTLGRRSLAVRITPTSGIHVDRDRAARAASRALAGAGFDTTANVEIAQGGVIA